MNDYNLHALPLLGKWMGQRVLDKGANQQLQVEEEALPQPGSPPWNRPTSIRKPIFHYHR